VGAPRPETASGADVLADLPEKTRRRLEALDTVLFDFDGTVVNTVELITASFRYTLPKVLGITLPDEVLIQNVGMPLLQQMQIFDPEKADELVRVYREHNRRYHDSLIEEFPGAREALLEVRQAGYKTGLVTSKSRELTLRGMRLFDLEPLFDVCIFCEDTTKHKPNPEPVLEALRRIEGEPRRSAFIGDSPHDITAGRAAGVLAIAALWGPFPRQRVLAAGPDVVLQSVGQLPELMRSTTAGRANASGPASRQRGPSRS